MIGTVESRAAPRWDLQPLVLIVMSMTWSAGDSQFEPLETARGFDGGRPPIRAHWIRVPAKGTPKHDVWLLTDAVPRNDPTTIPVAPRNARAESRIGRGRGRSRPGGIPIHARADG